VAQPEQWEYLAQPVQPELLGLTVLQEPPASLESLALLEQPELRAVMVLQAQQVSSV
jgi:hypothetical protein